MEEDKRDWNSIKKWAVSTAGAAIAAFIAAVASGLVMLQVEQDKDEIETVITDLTWKKWEQQS
ncbi:MAG: hypothetical protein ACK2T0_09335, partial [Anaerolineales bacterium]